ncbi:dUTP diphosphatase [Mycoplasma phocimorsus]|uniref:dUTP diphosphatase n=1 Tax=Mycoplasma phocimorsus TaxID=3045839 RepID=A0AAJ1UWU3_9MOLU|nr:dUTP diphosphatase [Mycoplasma phocimorsus]MDJ1645825.1 dUTP diphosphatase [Mycoplasma phocimorsus]MDJ1646444.1 dUTP diphosphatase [Mycoplasma phocimorsus]MDJ1646992.1 dUTP diphosphatase [Mycoplasma phocimorsus]MDJ1647440.1 dUTP diphosphatase [Mycoplasma phocimorsus]MDJ1648028.1 dUTP diphosphatase [Mycoplasma phocimorsus]
MNLKKIFEKQLILDEAIFNRSKKIHNIHSFDEIKRLTIIALIIELGEFMNEIETFKYWKKTRKDNKSKILDELADVLHFATSWAIRKNIDSNIKPVIYSEDPNEQFIEIMKWVNKWFDEDTKENIKYTIELIFGLASMVGFNDEEIEDSYMKKNQINFKRIIENY